MAGRSGPSASGPRARSSASYLPAQLADDELRDLVAAAIAETGADGPQAMGQVMRVVSPKTAGQAEGGRVAAEVRRSSRTAEPFPAVVAEVTSSRTRSSLRAGKVAAGPSVWHVSQRPRVRRGRRLARPAGGEARLGARAAARRR